MSTKGGTGEAMACDPLLTSVPLPYSRVFFPKGFPARVVSNSALVLAVAEESWGAYARRFAANPVEFRCVVSSEDNLPVSFLPPIVRAQRNMLVSVAGPENFACCDLDTGVGAAWVTEAVVAARAYFRYYVLEALTWTMLEVLHLVGLHAACVALDGRGILLAGDSGAGKSTLAYACARRGWTYCSDDASSLIRRGTDRTVLGDPHAFRFRESAAELFPEFSGMGAHRRGNGKPTLEIRTLDLPEIRTAPDCHVEHIVFLNRQEAAPAPVQTRLTPVSTASALARLCFDPWPPELSVRPERQAALRRLAEAEAHELRYRELGAAVDCLEELVLGGPV